MPSQTGGFPNHASFALGPDGDQPLQTQGTCRERLDFLSLVGFDAPDFRTISEFRKRHLKALGDLFTQILLLCQQAGLVKLGHVALDGTKIKANASKHKAMSYGRMEERIKELEVDIAYYLKAADLEEDRLHGSDKTGAELPKWIADKQQRVEKIRAAKAELEAEAKAMAEAKREAEAQKREAEEQNGKKPGKGRQTKPPSDTPETKAQKNFTDPESRIMKSKDGFIQGYNAQIAVDAEAQIIVAQYVTQSGSDSGQLILLTNAISANLGRDPDELSADAGYCSEGNLAALDQRFIDAYVATGRARDAASGKGKGKGKAPAADQPAETPTDTEVVAQQEAAQNTVDCGSLVPTADRGDCSESKLEALEECSTDAYVAQPVETPVSAEIVAQQEVPQSAADCKLSMPPTGVPLAAAAPCPQAHNPAIAATAENVAVQPSKEPTRVEAMREKIKAGGGHESPYRLRKQLPEPVFGQIKQGRGFRQSLLRGIDNVSGEWALAATAHNILKLANKAIKVSKAIKGAHRRTLSAGAPMIPQLL